MARENTCQFAILGMLCREPMSDYGLRQAIERTVEHFWQECYGNLYPAHLRWCDEAREALQRLARTKDSKKKVERDER